MEKRNIILIVVAIIIIISLICIYLSKGLYREYKKEVLKGIDRTKLINNSNLTEKDIKDLPIIVQNYIRYVGAIGKEKVLNFKVTFEGGIRATSKEDFMPVTVKQYSFYDKYTRLFYLNAKKAGISALGLHSYKNKEANMNIKLLGLIPIQYAEGEKMNIAETVTFLNDMCLFAPSTLIDNRIKWETIDSTSVKAIFNNDGIEVSALLYFNEKGELINFVSDDRYAIENNSNTAKQYTWYTPAKDYKDFNGRKVPSYAEAIWVYPKEEVRYATFNLKSIEYNVKEFK